MKDAARGLLRAIPQGRFRREDVADTLDGLELHLAQELVAKLVSFRGVRPGWSFVLLLLLLADDEESAFGLAAS
jgi:hypothetical protein